MHREAEHIRTLQRSSGNNAEIERRQQELITKLNESRQQGDLDVRTPKDRAVVYDNGQVTLDEPDPDKPGQRKVWRNRDRAEAFCEKYKDQGYTTIGGTSGGQYMESLKLFDTLGKDRATEQWRGLSADYARRGSTGVQGFSNTKSPQPKVFQPTGQPGMRPKPTIPSPPSHQWHSTTASNR